MSKPGSVKSNFLLHLHPEKIRARTLRPLTTLGLGAIAIVLLFLVTISGIALMFWYVPTPTGAYDRVMDLTAGALPAGRFFRNLHRFSSDALVIVVFLHMIRVYLTGALGHRRRLNWLIGLALFLVLLSTAFTGFLLPWDSRAYWATTVGGELLEIFPIFGSWFKEILWGGQTITDDTILRIYGFHVALLPVIGTILLAYHMWKIRKAGGLARPKLAGSIASSDENLVATRPELTLRELSLGLFTCAVMIFIAILWQAPLGPPGFPPRPLDPAKAPWFFLWMQELVSYARWLGAVVPIALILFLGFSPFFERDEKTQGIWFARSRRKRCIAFILIALIIICLTIIGSYFRGPGWELL